MSDFESSLSIHQTRRANLSALLFEFTFAKLSVSGSVKGIDVLFAEHIGVSRVTLCHMKGSRNISDKMAAQIETRTGHEAGWLDQPRASGMPSPGLQAFLSLASSVWQAGNAAERRRLMRMAKGGSVSTHS